MSNCGRISFFVIQLNIPTAVIWKSILEWHGTQQVTSDIDTYTPWGSKIGVSKIAAAWPSRKIYFKFGQNSHFLSIFWPELALKWPRIEKLGIFGILLTRRSQWCALMASILKKNFFHFSCLRFHPWSKKWTKNHFWIWYQQCTPLDPSHREDSKIPEFFIFA